MAQRELYTSLNDGKVQHLAPATKSTDSTYLSGTGIDLAGYNSALVIFSFGVSGDAASLSGSVKIEGSIGESDTSNSGWVEASDIVGTLPVIDSSADDDAVYIVSYVGSKRYILPGLNFTGTHTSGTPCAITVLRAHKRALNA